MGERLLESLPSQPGFGAHALHLLGDIAAHPERFDPETGETCYRRAIALAEPRGMRPVVAHCLLGLGTLGRRVGRRHEAERHLATAAAMYRDMDMAYWRARAERRMDELS